MTRPVRTLLLALVALGLVAGLAYYCTKSVCAHQAAGDDLAWLKKEFRLSDAELQRIRMLHEGYRPKCHEMCLKLAQKQDELEAALKKGTSPDEKLIELATIRAQCQAQMLRHFKEVSQAMPPEQGRRYLEEMQRLTLDLHPDFQSMGSMSPSAHGHDHGGN